MNLLGWRKFLAFLIALLVGGVLEFFGKLTPLGLQLVLGVFLGYLGANTVGKWQPNGNGNGKEVKP